MSEKLGTEARAAVAVLPDDGAALAWLGDALLQKGEPASALPWLLRCARLAPQDPNALFQLGLCLLALGAADKAVEIWGAALGISPCNPAIVARIAQELHKAGHRETAVALLTKAVHLAPMSAEIWNDFGTALRYSHRNRDAAIAFRRSIALDPSEARYYKNLGPVLSRLGFSDTDTARRAALIEPHDASAWANFAGVLKEQGRLRDARQAFQQALGMGLPPSLHSGYLLLLLHDHDVGPDHILAESQEFARRHAPGIPALPRRPRSGKPIKLGYVSADFRRHAVSYFIEPVLKHHDKDQFQVFAYYNGTHHDEVTSRLRLHVDHWREIAHLDDERLAGTIAEDQIDILVDLSGHSAGNRLPAFAKKPAPIQVTWLGYPGTTGLPQMDWRITDNYCDPPGTTEHHYSEKLWRLPEIWNAYQPPADSPEPPNHLPADTAGVFTFGCFNKREKLTPPTIALWARILRAVPNSRLMLKARGIGTGHVRRDILGSFAENGITQERLVLLDLTPDQFSPYAAVDLCLDPFPYNGTTTSMDCLWMGVPFLTLKGNHFASRTGFSILKNAGLEQLVTESHDEYAAAAIGLAKDKACLRALREGLRARVAAGPLMRSDRFTKNLEAAFSAMVAQADSAAKLS